MLSQRVPDQQSALAALDQAVSVQARTLAMVDVFYVAMVLVLTVVFLAWLLPAKGAAAEQQK